MTDPAPICLSPEQLRSLLEDAGEQGAKRTLARLGLEDEKAVQDLREVRDLLSAWRSARRVALETIVRTRAAAPCAAAAGRRADCARGSGLCRVGLGGRCRHVSGDGRVVSVGAAQC